MFSSKSKIGFGILAGALLAAATLVVPGARAQNPPAGAILDMVTAHPGAMPNYTQFSVNFVADNSTMDVSFAFRETPAFFGFDDASVVDSTHSGPNLLADPGFELASAGENCNFLGDGTACPPGWNAWIQPVDRSFIGLIGTGLNNNCGPNGPHSGNVFWCDGSVEGYDALYQQLTGLSVGDTYTVSFWLDDNSGSGMTESNPSDEIDMLVYAGDNIPVGTVPLNTVPEPGTLVLFGSGMIGLAGLLRRKLGK